MTIEATHCWHICALDRSSHLIRHDINANDSDALNDDKTEQGHYGWTAAKQPSSTVPHTPLQDLVFILKQLRYHNIPDNIIKLIETGGADDAHCPSWLDHTQLPFL
jgi:hypothetical protein